MIADVEEVVPLGRLADWLRDAGLDPDDDLRLEHLAGGSSNLTFRLRDAHHDWVLRRPPASGALPTAHDVLREFRIQGALAKTSVPVATMVGACADEAVIGAPFYVMDHVKGVVYTSPEQIARLRPEDAKAIGLALVDTLGVLHGVDPTAIGLGDLVRPEPFVDRQLRRWQGQWTQSRMAPLPLLDDVLEVLFETRPPPTQARLVHGDFNLGNVMFSESAPAAVVSVLDWELTAAGDPLADLGALLAYWGDAGRLLSSRRGGHLPDANPGCPSAAALVSRYEAVTGEPAEHVAWYRALATAKLAVICAGSILRMADPGGGQEVRSDNQRASVWRLVSALTEVAASELGLDSSGW